MSRQARDDRKGKEGRNFSGNASFSDNWYELWRLFGRKRQGGLRQVKARGIKRKTKNIARATTDLKQRTKATRGYWRKRGKIWHFINRKERRLEFLKQEVETTPGPSRFFRMQEPTMLAAIGPFCLGWGMIWLYIGADRGTKLTCGIFLLVVGLFGSLYYVIYVGSYYPCTVSY